MTESGHPPLKAVVASLVANVGRGFSLVLVGALLLSATASAQKVDVDELAILARAAPPEIAARALISLAASREALLNVKTPAARAKRIALLEEAWMLADSAQETVSRRVASGLTLDPRDEWRTRSSSSSLNRLSLKAGVLSGLAHERPVEARTRFLSLSLGIPTATCRDALVDDVQSYYITARTILQVGFAQAERKRGDHIVFVESLIGQMRSPAQVVPVMALLMNIDAPDELSRLMGVFVNVLRGIQGDDRTFSSAIRTSIPAMDIEGLVNKCRQRGIPVDPLIDAYRGYLVRHLTQSRCAPAGGRALDGTAEVNRFNTRLRLAASASIAPITEEEVKPARTEALPTPAASTVPSVIRALESEIAALKSTFRVSVVTNTTPGQPRRTFYVKVNGREYASLDDVPIDMETFLKVAALRQRLAQWRVGSTEDPEEHFHHKSDMYMTLFTTFPFGTLSEDVLRDLVDVLAQYDLDRHSRGAWYATIQDVLQRARSLGPETLARVRAVLAVSGHPALKAIVALSTAGIAFEY